MSDRPMTRSRSYVLVLLLAAVGLWAGAPARAQAGTYSVEAGLDYGHTLICGLGGYFVDSFASPANSCTNTGIIVGSPNGGGWTVANAANSYYDIPAPAGLEIVRSFATGVVTSGVNDGAQWGGGSFWQGTGGAGTYGGDPFSTDNFDSGPIASPYFAVQIVCDTSAGCTQAAYLEVPDLELTVEDDQTPTLSAVGGSGNLWSNTGDWVWNDRSDPWSLALTGTDPSGVCSYSANVSGAAGSATLTGGSESPNTAVWQQCAPWTWTQTGGASVDTTAYVPASGQLTVNIADVNQAGTSNAQSETVSVDNVAPTISISPLNDTDPTGSGDQQPAQLQVTPTAGPSGVSSVTCTVDGQSAALSADASAPGSYLLTVPDSQAHSISCAVQNDAVNPQGQHNTATADYEVRASSDSSVSFDTVAYPLIPRRVKQQTLVGWHFAAKLNKHGKPVKVKVGGHYVTKTVTKKVEQCHLVKTKVAKHKTTTKKVCVKPHTVTTSVAHLKHGASSTAHGQLLNGQGAPLAGQPVEIFTTSSFSDRQVGVGSVTTAADGTWTAKIPAGPSRVVHAYYAGDSGSLPATGTAQITVPAKVRVRISPTRLPWGKAMKISGQLVGGYVPSTGVAMRLIIKIPGLKTPYVGPSFRTTRKGTFSLSYVAPSVAQVPETFALSVDMVGAENGYPFTSNHSNWVNVRLGVPTPRAKSKPAAPGTSHPKTKKTS